MREFSGPDSRMLVQVNCNCCGRKMMVKNGIVEEGCIMARVPFGYFSKKDGQVHRFELCEACYDKIIAGFQIPVEIEEETVLL